MVRKYQSAAVGGTFDQLHAGHKALLERAFDVANQVFVGLTSDAFVASRGKSIVNNYEKRKVQLSEFLDDNFPGRRYAITKLESSFGAGIFTKEIDAIVVSEETLPSIEAANNKRMKVGLPKMKIEIVPMVMARDGKRISSTRIRAGEIDTQGNLR